MSSGDITLGTARTDDVERVARVERVERDDGQASVVPRSVGRVLDLLEIVLAADGCSLTAAANAAALTPTSALRHLRALEARGYLVRDEGGLYGVGPTMVRLSAGVRAGASIDHLIDAARPVLDELATLTGESAYLAVADGDTATYVACAESARAIRHVGWVGQHVPLATTALGAALQQPGTPAVRVGALERDITAVSCALPATGELRTAISVVGPSQRLDGDALSVATGAVAAAARRLAAVALSLTNDPQEQPR
jgi:DNA-binding IclR family transcriptional regulator